MNAIAKRSRDNLALGRRMRWVGKLPIPENADPLVKQFFRLLNRKLMTLTMVAPKARLRRGTMSEWRYGRDPTIRNFRKALNAIGFDLAIVPKGTPDWMRDHD